MLEFLDGELGTCLEQDRCVVPIGKWTFVGASVIEAIAFEYAQDFL